MERYANSARRLLTRFRPDPPTSLPSNRNGLVASVEQALARRARTQMLRQRFVHGGAIAAAAGVLLVGGLTLSRFVPGLGGRAGSVEQVDISPAHAGKSLMVLASGEANNAPDGTVILGPGASPQPLMHGMALSPGIRLVAPPTSEVRIGTADGTQLTLEPGGELTIVEQSAVQRYSLQRGAIRARVAKLQPGERFIIATEDGEVEVHGTVFRVSTVAGNPNCRGGAKTRVSVFEGVVSVRSGGSEAFVPAGGQWPEDCVTPTEVKTATQESVGASEVHTRDHRRIRRGTHRHARTAHRIALLTTGAAHPNDTLVAKATANNSTAPALGPTPPVASSTLSEQNDLFAEAVKAKRQQRDGESAELFSRLVDTYPNGPLTEGALVQRMRVLATVDHAAAARAATEYLARFPGGFARAAAHRIISGASP